MLSIFKIKAVIDGRRVKVKKGTTILEAAREAGIEVPTLCHVPGQHASGVCRVCVVEVERARTLVGSCHTPVSDGMVVHTRTPKVLATRRAVVELMLAAHTGECVLDPNADNCKLHNLASDLEAGAPRFPIPAPRLFPSEDDNPYVRRDLKKCIMCRKCIIACQDIAAKNVLAVGYRGFGSKIITGLDEALTTDACRECGICIEHCPTGALSRPEGYAGPAPKVPEAGSARSGKKSRAGALPMLKEEVARRGCLARPELEATAGRTGMSLAETFGVASFYSFLPRGARAENRIRICKCVPCEMKDARTVIGTIAAELGIGPGETTADGKFALEVVGCIGACDQAPAMLINDRLYGYLTPEKISGILKEYR